MPFGILPTRKSEPKASARKPRVSSDVEKRVYCGGASGIGPGGAGSKPEAANADAITAKTSNDPLIPATAGIQSRNLEPCESALGPRFRGDERNLPPKASTPHCDDHIPLFGRAPLAQQAFLRHRSNQGAVAGEYKAARVAARAVHVGRVLRIEQPIVGTERPVQPECMIKTGRHEFALEQRTSVRRQRSVEQRHVGRIG